MRPCLICVDLQRAFLEDRSLEPASGVLIAGVRAWQERFRDEGLPVVHVRTTVAPPELPPLPHWDQRRIRDFTAGADGWQLATGVEPGAGEPVVEKSHYSAFHTGRLAALIAEHDADELVLSGVHLHGCIRSTALDASAAGLRVAIAADATASNDPPHAAATRRWMSRRSFAFPELAAWNPAPPPAPPTHKRPIAPASAIPGDWAALSWEQRAAALAPLPGLLREEAPRIADQMAGEINKPLRDGLAEVDYAARVAQWALARGEPAKERTEDGLARRVPHGTVLLITPWNNPVGIPVGKLVPALVHGNGVVWKPSPHCPGTSAAIEELLGRVGLPAGTVRRVDGGPSEVAALISGDAADAVSVTGSLAAGRALQDLCAPNLIPLQAELGGNNASVIGEGADVEAAAEELVAGAFSFAGQRCTAIRRAIAVGDAYGPLVAAIKQRVEALRPGAPREEEATFPPMRSQISAERIEALLARAEADGASVWRPAWASSPPFDELRRELPFAAPALVEDADPASEIVQEESFGPVLVVTAAADLADALERMNEVRHGLVATIHSSAAEEIERFEVAARAGVLKVNRSGAGAAASLPFGGLGISGAGPPEHGPGDAEFYSRWQAVSP